MKIGTLASHASQLLSVVYKSPQPADRLVSEYLRKKKYIGSKERKFVSETVFHCLRNYMFFENAAEYIFEGSLCNHKVLLDKELSDLLLVISGIALNSGTTEKDSYNALYLINLQPQYSFEDIHTAINEILKDLELNETINFEIIQLKINKYKEKIENEINAININNLSDENIKSLTIRFSVNDLVIKSLLKYLNPDKLIPLLKSLSHSAKLNIRFNHNITNYEDLEKNFSANHIPLRKCKYSPQGLIIDKRVQLNQLEIFKNGTIEVQDEGSQLISFALNPPEKSRILDACAGAGGKSLHLAALTNDKAEIVACDIDNRKLNELRKRSNRCGFKNIKTVHIYPKIKAEKHRDLAKGFDYILVDAPCSGLGTTRRMPTPKYRINKKLLKRLQDNQLRILEYYSQFLRDYGKLVYSTCSLLYKENQEVIELFLSRNTEFELFSIRENFDEHDIKIPELLENETMLNLLPSEHETDGFFMAGIKRK